MIFLPRREITLPVEEDGAIHWSKVIVGGRKDRLLARKVFPEYPTNRILEPDVKVLFKERVRRTGAFPLSD
ncbi:MAG TPA: hypothetical protein VI997_02850 [Candidatus Thermoplasmatota archaeon]|nr:hypothetical protein [Candidatus Thermoplasmatota archaeon]